jgi:hypothetical protein
MESGSERLYEKIPKTICTSTEHLSCGSAIFSAAFDCIYKKNRRLLTVLRIRDPVPFLPLDPKPIFLRA